jgi:hypothetical protein
LLLEVLTGIKNLEVVAMRLINLRAAEAAVAVGTLVVGAAEEVTIRNTVAAAAAVLRLLKTL